MYKYGIDLHTHTNYSDGNLSPNELVKLALKKNIKTIAITDHDTVKGLSNIDISYRNNMNIIDGIELTAKVDKGRMHILGYGIDKNNIKLNNKLKEIKDRNINYIIDILAQLKKDYGIMFSYEEIKKLFNSYNNLNRVDIAKLLVDNAYVDSVQDAFDKYLVSIYEIIGGSNRGLSYQECIKLIHDSGGISVLAHPKTLDLNYNELYKFVKYMKDCGLDGIEVYNSIHSKEDVDMYLDIAKRLDLLISDEYKVIESLDEIGAVGHRIVHGGEIFDKSVLIDDDVISKIQECASLAPLHNPAALLGIKACQEAMPGVPMSAVFDTA